jgi:pyruvate,orthophosphate dikinase
LVDKRFGDATAPLLLSVRSGAAISMPGMMDTVLNLGLTDEVANAMAIKVRDQSVNRAAVSFTTIIFRKGYCLHSFASLVTLSFSPSIAWTVFFQTGNARFAYDSYRRFLEIFGDVVVGIPHHNFAKELDALKLEAGVSEDKDLTAEQLKVSKWYHIELLTPSLVS